MGQIPFFSKDDIIRLCPFTGLISALEKGFLTKIKAPERTHLRYGDDYSHLIMPSFGENHHGVKLVNIHHNNREKGYASIQGIYILFDSNNGIPLAMMDGKALTNMRTAAISALASKYLSREDSKTLLMIGNGSLAPFMIRAHQAVRNLETIFIWGRDYEKSIKLAALLNEEFDISVVATRDKSSIISGVDIISSATSARKALIFGEDLRPGQHIDLVGSYEKGMEECDSLTLKKSSIYVDARTNALAEAGEIIKALKGKYINKHDIKGEINYLVKMNTFARRNDEEITLFKSVGLAKEDLISAQFLLEASLSKP